MSKDKVEPTKQYQFNEDGEMVETGEVAESPYADLAEQLQPCKLSKQALVCFMAILNNGIAVGRDITQDFLDLDFKLAPNDKLYITNPPFMQVSPEMEDAMKARLDAKVKQAKLEAKNASV